MEKCIMNFNRYTFTIKPISISQYNLTNRNSLINSYILGNILVLCTRLALLKKI